MALENCTQEQMGVSITRLMEDVLTSTFLGVKGLAQGLEVEHGGDLVQGPEVEHGGGLVQGLKVEHNLVGGGLVQGPEVEHKLDKDLVPKL